MFKTSTPAYWCCQVAGWGLVWGTLKLNGYYGSVDQHRVLITISSGLLATHALRTIVRRYLPPTPSFRKEGLRLIGAIIFTTGLVTALRCLGHYFFTEYDGIYTPDKVFVIITDSLLFVIPWMLIYWFYRLVVYNRTQARERRRLEWRLREMQTHAGESGVTMEDLMKEIGHITALIDENPARARSEITSFSRLLREGYLA